MAVSQSLRIDDYGNASYLWEGLGGAETGNTVKIQRWTQKWVQVTGTFGSATVTVQVSNDGSTWVTATTDGSTACTFTSAGIKRVFENMVFTRVITSGGTGSDLDVTLSLSREA